MCKRTVSRGLTISYHPGIDMPRFCTASLVELFGAMMEALTTVMGIFGALGNMNLTS